MRPSLRRRAGWLALLLLLGVAPLVANHVFIVTRSLPPAIAGFLYRARLISTVEFGNSPEPATWTRVSGTLPPGLAIDTRGLISGTVPAGTDGTFRFTLQARDDRLSHTAQQEFVIPVIRPGSTELRIITTGMWFASEGRRWEEYLDAVGGTPPYRWTLVQGTLPQGVQLDEGGRLIGSIARGQAPRTYFFDARVTDSANRSATASFSIPVGGEFVDFTTPSRLLTMLNTERFPDGRRILPTLTGEGGFCSGYQVFGSLPRGLVITAEGAMLGAPSESGQFGFHVQCDDFTGRRTIKAFHLLVLPSATLLGATTLPAGAVGSAYSHTLIGQSSLPPVQYVAANSRTGALLSGNSPAPGLTLNRDTGQISGTPTTAGQYEFDARVLSNYSHWFGGIFHFNTLTLNITAAPPVVTPPLAITTASLPDGAIGVVYRQTLEATGGRAPYTWRLAVGSLPPGVSLAGNIIQGTPTLVGSSGFRLEVRDQDNQLLTRDYTIRVNTGAVPRLALSTPANSTSNQQVDLQLTLDANYPSVLQGQLRLRFTPQTPANARDDDMIMFSNGSRLVNFTVAANQRNASFTGGVLRLLTGTTAGQIDIDVASLTVGTTPVAASPSSWSVTVATAVPTLNQPVVTGRTATGFLIQSRGFSNTRELVQALYQFTVRSGVTVQTTDFTVQLATPGNTWFGSAASQATGGQFNYDQPFTVSGTGGGDAGAVLSVTVTLVNRNGSSQTRTVTF